MSDDPPARPPLPVLITAILGSVASDDGHSIKVGVEDSAGGKADIILSTDRAVELLTLISAALGQAARRRTDDPTTRHVLPVESWRIESSDTSQTLALMFHLPGGAELCFQIDRASARHMRETLGVLLGEGGTHTPPKSQIH